MWQLKQKQEKPFTYTIEDEKGNIILEQSPAAYSTTMKRVQDLFDTSAFSAMDYKNNPKDSPFHPENLIAANMRQLQNLKLIASAPELAEFKRDVIENSKSLSKS